MKKLIIPFLLSVTFIANGMENHSRHSMHQNSNQHMNAMDSSQDKSEIKHHSHNLTFEKNKNIEFERELLIPPMLKGELKSGVRVFNLETTKGEWEFISGKKAETYGYNGPILGPVLALNSGEKTKINIKNNLEEETTVHWHGAIVSQNVDGVHHSDIFPNQSRSVEFTLNQPEATLWFHPHPMHKTAKQVYKGLAGLIYLKDENSSKLNLPKEYGVDDFPIVIQDKKLSSEGKLEYTTTHMEKIHGKSGGYLMINGIVSPFVEILQGYTRLRIINGSNATNYEIDLQGKKFYQVASDGGLLSSPIEMTKLILAPGERGEILVDSNTLQEKDYLYVNGTKALEFKKTNKKGVDKLQQNLTTIPEIKEDLSKLKTREFILKTTSKSNTINGEEYDMEKTNFQVEKGKKEIWSITNSNGMMDMPHPFHVHGAQFRIIERNGQIPPLNEQGWKDTINLNAGDNVKILIEYVTDGITVYHCHILEHEEMGMMGQFKIE